ncbi:hypothetical protein PCK1_001638 [Pneumocystis canis]|nr:hypothetical protein PCK1_001638 [Pneumocystis canis]
MPWLVESWYMDIPIVTRLFITGAVATSLAVQCNWVTPFQLFFSWHSVIIRKQYWRLITTFLYFGNLSFDFLFHIFFIARYCRMLEETSFRGRSWEFACLLLYAATSLLILSPLVSLTFLASPLSFCLIYLWSRRNPSVRLSFLGLFVFNAPYLPSDLERRKWIHCFENVTAVLFLVAISGYDQCLIEDNGSNQMQEALVLFDSICNSQWFINTSIILFLNKIDLFKVKLHVSLISNYFPDFNKDNQNDYRASCLFFRQKFLKLNRNHQKTIYTHFTNATDTTLLKNVMVSVSDIIFNQNLQNLML